MLRSINTIGTGPTERDAKPEQDRAGNQQHAGLDLLKHSGCSLAPAQPATEAATPIEQQQALDRTCAEIAARWRRAGLCSADAEAEADRFAARYHRLQRTQTLSEAELDATLQLVADAMAAP